MYYCQQVLVAAMHLAGLRFGLSESSVGERFLVDNVTAPELGPGLPMFAPYVDNANVLVWDRRDGGEVS
jgi:hypothetical protein